MSTYQYIVKEFNSWEYGQEGGNKIEIFNSSDFKNRIYFSRNKNLINIFKNYFYAIIFPVEDFLKFVSVLNIIDALLARELEFSPRNERCFLSTVRFMYKKLYITTGRYDWIFCVECFFFFFLALITPPFSILSQQKKYIFLPLNRCIYHISTQCFTYKRKFIKPVMLHTAVCNEHKDKIAIKLIKKKKETNPAIRSYHRTCKWKKKGRGGEGNVQYFRT